MAYRPGQLTRFGSALRAPEGRLVFATSDIATKWAGWFEGAIASGTRAAEQVSEILRGKNVEYKQGHTEGIDEPADADNVHRHAAATVIPTGRRSAAIPAPLPPGPKGHIFSGNLPEFARDRLGFLTMCAREYGDVVPFRLGPRRFVLLSHPDDVEDVLVTNSRGFIKHYLLRMNRLLLGNGLLVSEGNFWLRQRRLAQPAFHKTHIAAYGDVMVAQTERMLATWQDGDTRDVHAEMMHLTLGIVAKTLFDAEVAGEAADVGAALQVLLEIFIARMDSLFMVPERVPTLRNLRLRRAVRRLDEIIYRIINRRRTSGEDRGDLLSLLLRAQDEDGSHMTDKQLRDEALTLFLAGHETTALVLTWAWYLLWQHPDAEAALAAELQQVLGGRAPTVADLPRLQYTEMVVLEAMRLYPPAYTVGREALHDCVIGGYEVPAGTTLLMSQWVLHRDPRYFDRPEEFVPGRWADGLAKRLPRHVFIPFGGGPRLCIGNAFAMMEAVLLLATMAQRFRFSLVPGHPVTLHPSVTLRPKHGMKMVLHPRL